MADNLEAAKAHKHQFVLSDHVHLQLHGSDFNAMTARWISDLLSNMNFFWVCVVLDILAIPGLVLAVIAALASHNLVAILLVLGAVVVFLAQTVIQLLALPSLGAQGKLNQASQDAQSRTLGKTADATHQLTVSVHSMMEAVHGRLFEKTEEEQTDGRSG